MNDAASPLLTLYQLSRRAREATSVEALGFVMVNETHQLLPYRQAALWLTEGLGRVVAVSGLPQPNPAAPYTQWLTQVFRAIAKMEGVANTRALTSDDLPASLAQDWADWLPAHALCAPLKGHDGGIIGLLLLASDEAWPAQAQALAVELAGVYGHALAALAPRTHTSWRGWLQDVRRRRWLLAGIALVALFPVRQSVLAPAEVVPKEPFLVRAPQDGVIERILVRPNQPVKAGTALFNLDRTALETRYAIARKAYDTAQEEYRQSAQLAVTEDKGKQDVSVRRGALEEKRLELAYTAEQLGRVQVNAERDGVAVFSDVNDWQGKAVALGERVLTLADPAKVELDVFVPVGERFNMRVGQVLHLYPNASPLTAIEAKVTQVAYSAEATREGQMAYRVKADFAPRETLPRLGTMGNARLQGQRVPLIYHALRRPLTAVRQWLGV